MHTKLTLSMDREVIEGAKRWARGRGRPLSVLVADMLKSLASDSPQRSTGRIPREEADTPLLRRWRGVLKGVKLDEEDYHRYLEEKYQ